MKTFEDTYPQYPFAELVRLSIELGRLIGERRRRESAEASALWSINRTAGTSQIQTS